MISVIVCHADPCNRYLGMACSLEELYAGDDLKQERASQMAKDQRRRQQMVPRTQ